MAAPHPPARNFYAYLPITDKLLHGGFYVTGVGHSVIEPDCVYPPKSHPSLYHFCWKDGRTLPEFSLMLLSGPQGVFETRETGRVTFEGEAVILLFPGVWHRYRPDPKTGWSEKWMSFNGEFAHGLLASKVVSPERPFLRRREVALVDTLFDGLVTAVRRAPTGNSMHLSLLALGVLAGALEPPDPIAAETSPGDCKPLDPMVTAAIDHIWTRSHSVLSVSQVAEAVGVTRRSLERHMMESTGRSVLDAIIQCRYSRAERLLRETDLPIKAVTSLSGFGSEENMRRVFVERAGCPPGTYRSSCRSADANSASPVDFYEPSRKKEPVKPAFARRE